jgi:hypothetical protein
MGMREFIHNDGHRRGCAGLDSNVDPSTTINRRSAETLLYTNPMSSERLIVRWPC